jgi:glycosyltransferase involved in cell wall biosynthesis
LPALEAMACGAAVVAANSSALPEVVGSAGLLFNPRDPSDLAAALKRVATDSSLRRELAQAGPRRAATFTWERAARDTLTVLEAAARN